MKNLHKQFPGKMDKTTKRTYKLSFKMGYGKLKHVKLFESFDSLNENFSEDELEKIKEVIKKTSMMSLRKPLEDLGFIVQVNTYDQPMPPIIIEVRKNKNDKKRVVIVNRKYTDDPDFVHDEVAMRIMESAIPLNEVEVEVKTKEQVETTKSARTTKAVLSSIEELYTKMNEYKALLPILKAMEEKSKEIAILKDELIPELQKYNAQSFRIKEFLVELSKTVKMKGERTTFSYAAVVKDIAAISKKMESLVETTKELHKTVHPAEAIEQYDLSVRKVDEGIVDWAKEIFGQLASKFKGLWAKITSGVDSIENDIDNLTNKLKPLGIKVPTTEEAIKSMNKF